MSEQNAYQLTQMLQNVVNDGTGRSARLDRPVAGKTGTVQSGIAGNSSNRDVWFVGYTRSGLLLYGWGMTIRMQNICLKQQ